MKQPQAERADAESRDKRGIRVVKDDERALLLRHREGDPEAFAALVGEYRAPVYAYLVRCGVDAADRDDLFQEIFLRIHRGAGSYQAQRPVHPWLFTIVSNAVRSYVRKRRVRQLVFAGGAGDTAAEDPADDAPDGARRSQARQAAALVQEELHRLPLVQREVVLLACVESLKLKDVAAALEIPLNTVKTHLRRARLTLARALARHDRGRVTP